MRTDLTPAEVVTWLREKSAGLSRTADSIEQTFAGEDRSAPSFSKNGVEEPHPRLTSLSDADLLDNIIDLINGGKSMRRATVAEKLGVPEHAVAMQLTEHNGFVRNKRGWYTYSPALAIGEDVLEDGEQD